MGIVYDMVPSQRLQGFVRGVFNDLNNNVFTLSGVLPNQNITDIDFSITQGVVLDQDAATARSWDAPVEIASRQGLTRLMGELPPLGRKIRLGEEEKIRLNQFLRNGGTGENPQAIASIYNDVSNMARAVAARMEMWRGEALHSGAISIRENGVKLDVDFGRNPLHDYAPATLWSDPAAKAIDDELDMLDIYFDTNTDLPAAAIFSTEAYRLLQRNEDYCRRAAVLGNVPTRVSLAQINTVRTDEGLPPIVVYRTRVRVAGVKTPVIPVNKIIYVPTPGPLGATLLGVTSEALSLAEAREITQDQLSGMTAVVLKEEEPVATWTKVSAVGLPILANPDLTMVATIS